jgi:CubicO group peptidase (beta-lactamase class C family)
MSQPSNSSVAAHDVYADQQTTRWFMQHVRRVLGTADLRSPPGVHAVFELPEEPRDLSTLRTGDRTGAASTLAAVLEETHTDAFLVLHKGAIVFEEYFNGMTPETPHMWQSVSKSLVSCVAGSLIADGRLDAQDRIGDHVPELARSAYGDALVRHLLDMQVGIEYSEDYADPDSDVNELDRIYGVRPPRSSRHPGSSYDYATTTRKQGLHGEGFAYVSLDVNVLAWVLERATGAWLPDLIRSRLWSKLGGEHDAYVALDVAGNAQAESGVCSSLRDLARLGLALSQRGELGGRQVVPAAWVEEIMSGGDREAFATHEEAMVMTEGSYKDNFWVTRSGEEAAFQGSGIYGQMIHVNPKAQLVVAKFSTQPEADSMECFRLELRLCEQLADFLVA